MGNNVMRASSRLQPLHNSSVKTLFTPVLHVPQSSPILFSTTLFRKYYSQHSNHYSRLHKNLLYRRHPPILKAKRLYNGSSGERTVTDYTCIPHRRHFNQLHGTGHENSTNKIGDTNRKPTSRLSEDRMKIATLQFAPKLGDVLGNIQRANQLLGLPSNWGLLATEKSNDSNRDISNKESGAIGRIQVHEREAEGDNDDGDIEKIEALKPDILILPELAFTGYNFPSLEAIRPFLEIRGEGPTATWARKTARYLRCKVCVGYPELEKYGNSDNSTISEASLFTEKYFNSLLVVNEDGEVIFNYRKRFLYYTDDTWASEGDINGFQWLNFKSQSSSTEITKVPTTFGICMDINPYKFTAPYSAWEFANQVLNSQSQLVILSMAWLTAGPKSHIEELGTEIPDMDTFNYWIRRFWPLIARQSTDKESNANPGPTAESSPEMTDVILAFANRSGEEDGEGITTPALYAGTSTIITLRLTKPTNETTSSGMPNCQILCWDMKGAMEEGICFADTSGQPKMTFSIVSKD